MKTDSLWATGLFSGFIAVVVSTTMEIFYNRRTFRLQSFERFCSEYDRDPKLREASDRFDDDLIPNDFIESFLSFFETVGYYHAKNIVNRALVACTFGDDICDAYEHACTTAFIKKTREEARNKHYYEWFVCMAEWCQLQEKLEKSSNVREWLRVRFVDLPAMRVHRWWSLYRLWFGPRH